MALIFADGFEHYGTGTNSVALMSAGLWSVTQSTTYISVVATRARTGSRSLRLGFLWNGGPIAKRAFNTPSEICGVGFGLYLEYIPTSVNHVNFCFVSESTNVVCLAVTPSGALSVYKKSPSGTLLGTTDSGLIGPLSFNHIEMKVVRDNVVGEVEVRVNGVTVIKSTDLDLGTDHINGFVFSRASSGIGPDGYIDDLIIWDGDGDVNNDFFGPARVLTVFADGEGTHNDWSVVGASTPHEAIDETTPDGDTTYIAASTVGDKQSLTVPELPPEVATVAGVFIPPMAKLGSAGTGNMKVSIESDGAIAEGPDTPLTTAYTYWPAAFEKDPATGAQFDKAALEAAEIIIEKTA